MGFLWSWPARATLCCSVQASHCSGFWFLLWSTGSRAWAQQSWQTGLVAPWHVGSFRTRDRTHVPCIGRQTPNHWTTREVPTLVLGTIPHLTHSVFSLVISSAKVNSMNTRYFGCCVHCCILRLESYLAHIRCSVNIGWVKKPANQFPIKRWRNKHREVKQLCLRSQC